MREREKERKMANYMQGKYALHYITLHAMVLAYMLVLVLPPSSFFLFVSFWLLVFLPSFRRLLYSIISLARSLAAAKHITYVCISRVSTSFAREGEKKTIHAACISLSLFLSPVLS